MQATKPKALSWSQLAKQREITRDTLARYRKMPGAPSTTDPAEWDIFFEKNGLKKIGSKELRDEKTKREIKLLDTKIDREQRRVISRDEVSRLLLHIASQQRSKLYQFLETEAPPKLDGLSAAQQRPILREMADSICDTMAALVEEFEAA